MAAAGTPGLQTRLRFAPTSSADAGAGGSTSNLGPRRPEVTSMEGSAAPNQSDHRADAGIPASENQGHDAGRAGVEIESEGQAEQPHA